MDTIEQYIIESNSKNASIICFLRQLILSCSKHISERILNDVPFYFYHGRLCYTCSCDNGGVVLAFCHGEDISDPFTILENSTQQGVKTLTFKDIKDIDYDKVIPLLQQALLINELKARVKLRDVGQHESVDKALGQWEMY